MPKNPFARHERSDGTDAVGGVHHATPRYGERYQASGGKPSGRARRSGRAAERTAEPSLLARTVNQWWNRLLGAVYSRSFSEQSEQYMAHRTTRDYVCNTIGQAAWGGLFPLLTIVCTQLVGAEQAGYFSMAFVVGTLLLFLGNYGVRAPTRCPTSTRWSPSTTTSSTASSPAWPCSAWAWPTAPSAATTP